MQNTKRSLLTSVTALLLCFVMLIGTTFAWFTDQATSANNIIKAGTLDIAMSWSEDNSAWNDTEGAGAKPVFDYRNWEPGYTEVRYIKVQNLGSLAFKYKMAINPTGAVGKLAEVIDVSFDIVTDNASFVAPTADNKQGSLTNVATLKQLIDGDAIVAGGVLLPDGETAPNHYSGEIVICVSFHMQETAGNEYQGASIGDAFGINLYATQYDYENDSFGNSYDDGATWPEEGIDFSASTSIDAGEIVLGVLANDVSIGGAGIGATVPANVKIADGASSLDLTVKSVTSGSNLTLGEGESAKLVDVHIAGVASDNTVPMIVNLGKMLEPGLSDTEVKFYHTEGGTPTLMTRVNSAADFAIHNQYTYNPATGEVSIYVATFSVFSAVNTSADVWDGTVDTSWHNDSNSEFTLTTAEQFAGFRVLVDGGNTFEGKTIKLGADIDLAGKLFDPIGYNYESNGGQVFKGTFDGQKHTIYNLYQNGWDLDPDKTNYNTYTYSTAGGGLFASVKDATIKNLAISGADIVMECVDMGILAGYAYGECTFDNIVVTKSKIANYNRYTGGVVGEVNGTHIFSNITVDSSVKISALWGTFDPGIGGVIGGKYGDATISMTNVTVACELDVFSDVTSAYQWYAYRRCGMLIGHTEESAKDPVSGTTFATADFLSCENVKVYYGNWVNYTYYQFTNQDEAWCNNYPWVRAEEGEHNDAYSNPRYGVPVINGEKITDTSKSTGTVNIPFNQLYGGGQGVYGQAKHNNVTVTSGLTKTVYFKNEWNWQEISVYYWLVNGSDEWQNIEWPGEKMNYDNNLGLYYYEVPSYAYGFIINGKFNGKSVQTADLSVDLLKDNHIYTPDINEKTYGTNDNPDTYTVFFQNNWKWKDNDSSDVTIYYWGSTQNTNPGWPGYAMTHIGYDGTHDIYSYEVPNDISGLLFVGINNDNNAQNQTNDITDIEDGTVYCLDGWDNNGKVKYKIISCQ